MSNYKDDYSPHENIPLTNLINCYQKETKKSNYMIVDDACAAIADFFSKGNESLLINALDSLSFFFEYQKIVKVPQSFQEFDVMQILLTIINDNQQFNPNIIKNTISALKYIFRSSQMCSAYLSEEIIANICNIINKWDKIFLLTEENHEIGLISIGDLIQILNSFILHDNSFLTLITSISPIQFIIDMVISLPFHNVYVLVCFASYFYTFFDIADSNLVNSDLNASILFFRFCALCYQDEIKPAYQYNLYTLSILVQKLAQNFSLEYFIKLELNKFINSALLEDDNDILFQAIRVISYFFSPINNKKVAESDASQETSSICTKSVATDGCFLQFPKDLFDIESLVVLPKLRDHISNDVRLYSVIVLKTVFQYNYEFLILFFKYEMPEFFISQFRLKSFDMKKAICSLFLYIIEIISEEFIIEMIEEGLFNMFIDFLQTETLTYEILYGIRLILDRLQNSDKFPFFVVLLQEESFQNTLLETISGEDQKCAEIASVLKEMTLIEGEEE